MIGINPGVFQQPSYQRLSRPSAFMGLASMYSHIWASEFRLGNEPGQQSTRFHESGRAGGRAWSRPVAH